MCFLDAGLGAVGADRRPSRRSTRVGAAEPDPAGGRSSRTTSAPTSISRAARSSRRASRTWRTGRGEHEKLELMDGQPREFIRHNDDVRCYVPDSKLVLVEKRGALRHVPRAADERTATDIDQYYRLSLEGDRPHRRAARAARRPRGARQAALRLPPVVRPGHVSAAEGADAQREGRRDRADGVHRRHDRRPDRSRAAQADGGEHRRLARRDQSHGAGRPRPRRLDRRAAGRRASTR